MGGDEWDTEPIDSYEDDIERIWFYNCVLYCHGIPILAEDLDLDWGKGYDMLVSRPSQQVDMNLVEPYDPERSYLWHKLNGTYLDVGGDDDAMPAGDCREPLDGFFLDRIETWIMIGAPP